MGVGVLPLDDVFQVHVSSFSTENQVGLADNQLVLKPGVSYTAEWAILPTETADYYAFLNAMRRLRDVNFTLAGSFAFLRADPRLGATQDLYRVAPARRLQRRHPPLRLDHHGSSLRTRNTRST